MTSNSFAGSGRPGYSTVEVQRVAQAVSEEQLGDREGAVLRPDLEHVPAERFAAHEHVVVQVDGRLGRSRGARRVLPKGHVILRRDGGHELGALRPDQLGIRELGGRGLAHDHQVREIPQPGAQLLHDGGEWLAHNHDRSPAVAQDVFIIARLEQGIGRNGHGPDLERAPEAAHELRAVVQQQDHPLLHRNAEPPQHVAQPVCPGVHVAVGEPAAFVDDRQPAIPAFLHMAVDEPVGGVQVARDHGADITPRPPGVKLAERAGRPYVGSGALP